MTLLESLLQITPLWFAIRLLGFGLLSGISAGIVAFIYRVRFNASFPDGASLIVGVGVVAVYINSRLVFIQFVGDVGDPLAFESAVENIAIFVVAAMTAFSGKAGGDKLATAKGFGWASRTPSLDPIVRATGRFITVTLPDEINDIEGYDPVASETKAALAGNTFDFPKGLTVDELHRQVRERLQDKHDIGYVDLDIAVGGTVEYLAVGQRPAGLGRTLPPSLSAVALKADPPFSASPGDTVEIWEPADPPASVGMGEVRAIVDDVVTIACESSVAQQINPQTSYRLLTHAADEYPDREFASILRRSEETVRIIEVGSESSLVGVAVGAVDVTVIAIKRAEEVLTIPYRGEVMQAGDRLVIIGTPERMRKLERENGLETASQA